jgi:hypothetical protein
MERKRGADSARPTAVVELKRITDAVQRAVRVLEESRRARPQPAVAPKDDANP